MPSPFPGMDPYLENPRLWSAVHHSLLSAFQDQLSPLLRPKYIIRAEERAYPNEEAGEAERDRVPDVHVIRSPNRPGPPATSAGLAIAEPVPVIDLIRAGDPRVPPGDPQPRGWHGRNRDRGPKPFQQDEGLVGASQLPPQAAGGLRHAGPLDGDRPAPRRGPDDRPIAAHGCRVPRLPIEGRRPPAGVRLANAVARTIVLGRHPTA
jgi:hypothetical protein